MAKSYSEDFRKCALSLISRGKSKEEVCELLEIGIASLNRWIRLKKKTGSLKKREYKPYKTRKVDPEILKKNISENPDATLEELGEMIGCCHQTIDYWCRKLGVTRKKNHAIRRKG